MQAAVVPAVSSSWQVKDVPQPQPGPNQVLVKMHASGICLDHQLGALAGRLDLVGDDVGRPGEAEASGRWPRSGGRPPMRAGPPAVIGAAGEVGVAAAIDADRLGHHDLVEPLLVRSLRIVLVSQIGLAAIDQLAVPLGHEGQGGRSGQAVSHAVLAALGLALGRGRAGRLQGVLAIRGDLGLGGHRRVPRIGEGSGSDVCNDVPRWAPS